jgi:hypothetical protein
MFLCGGMHARSKMEAVFVDIMFLVSSGRSLNAVSTSAMMFLCGIFGPFSRRGHSASVRGFFDRFIHPISAFDAGWQPEILFPIARLPAGLYYSILFVQKMRAFRRLVLECFHKQKTTKIKVHFPKIIELHLNSSPQCIQLAMRRVNKREKKQLRQREKLRIIRAHSEIRTHDLRVNLMRIYTLCYSRTPPHLTRNIC